MRIIKGSIATRGIAAAKHSRIVVRIFSFACFITQNVASGNFHFRKQIDGDTGIKDVSAGKQKVDGISQCIHNSMDFCSLSTMTYTDKLVVF